MRGGEEVKLKAEEYEIQFQSISKLIDLRRDNPGLETKQVIEMIEQIIVDRKGLAKIAGEPIEKKEASITTKQRGGFRGYRGLRKDNYDLDYNLIGKDAKEWYRGSGMYDKNPYGIKVGFFDRCTDCQKVGIVSITSQHQKNKDGINETIVYKCFMHSNKNGNIPKPRHYERIDLLKGKLDWNGIMRVKGGEKK